MSTDKKADNLQEPIVFQDVEKEEVTLLSPGQTIKQEDSNELIEKMGSDDSLNTKNRSQKRRHFLFYALGGVAILSIVEMVMWLVALIEQGDWLDGMWFTLIVSVLLYVGFLAVKEVKQWFHFSSRQELQAQGALLQASPSIGLGQAYCETVVQNMGDVTEINQIQWREKIPEHLNDKEVLAIFEQEVVHVADKRALSIVMQHASASSAMIAVSPFALLDMLIVLWRNLRMLNEISQVYGIHTGYIGRIRLFRHVIKTMLYAGASEILVEAGSAALGASVVGKISTRVAQGVGAGVLTGRLGFKAMEVCRPMPWLHVSRPGIQALSKQLLIDLKGEVSQQ